MSSEALAQEADYRLEEVKPDLYRFVAGSYRSMVWVTDDGIVVLDTLNTEAAKWLKTELDEHFDVPVRYVVYSHSHYDHAYGGQVFADPSVTFIAHDLTRSNFEMSKADTHFPELTFSEDFALNLGGETLSLRYHGPNNGFGSVSMLFEDQDVIFVVDWAIVGRMPWTNLEGYNIEGMIRSTKAILELEWDTFVGGHAEIGERADVERYLAYLEALYGAVRDGMLDGKDLETLQAEIRLDEFSDFKQYDAWLADNIGGVYRQIADQSYILKRPEVAGE
ncbi:MAG: MBL fold metallo-hydrolase [Ponticaulis sp.]|nr:MBL fold metallo-hydrolase [Ponticaulis sp.]